MNIQALSLKDLNELVSEVIRLQMRGSYWLEAELSQMNENRGHCYMEFVQKDETSNNIIAIPCTIWLFLDSGRHQS